MTKKGKKEDKGDKPLQIDFHVDLGLPFIGSLFKNFDQVIKQPFFNIAESIEKGEVREYFKPIEGDKVRGFIRYRVGPLTSTATGKVTLKARPPAVEKTKPREPLIDVFEEKEEVVVLAEVPGVPEDAVEVEMVEGRLHIKGGDKFFKELDVPGEVDYSKMKKSYNNGVLEIRLPKKA